MRPIRMIRSRGNLFRICANFDSQPEELSDPIGDEAHSPVEGIVHRYPDRVLLKLVNACAVYCRFCFRREMVGPGRGGLSRAALAAALDYIRATPQIWEVILTGGDPLVLSPRRLKEVTTDACRDRARQGDPRAHARAGRGAGTGLAGFGARATRQQGDLRRPPCQSSARAVLRARARR